MNINLKIIGIITLITCTTEIFGQTQTGLVTQIGTTKIEKKADKDLKTYTGKVKAREGGAIIVILNDGDDAGGVKGTGAMGYSLINQGSSKPKKVLTQQSAEARRIAREKDEEKRTVELKGHPNAIAVFIGSTITFKGIKKGKTIEWSE